MSRRSFTCAACGVLGLMAIGAAKFMPETAQVRPPGGQDEDHLLSACIRCQRCVEICPRGALQPSNIEKGILPVRTPVTNFDNAYCDFCTEENGGTPLCVAACPSKALKLDDGATVYNTILGKASITTDWCLAWRLNNGCHFCVDACPYNAMELDVNKNPVVLTDACTGCGACQSVCVSQQEGSIAAGATARAITVGVQEI